MAGALPILSAVFSIASSFGGMFGGGDSPEPPAPTPIPPPPPPAPVPVAPALPPEQTAAITPEQSLDLEAAKSRQIRRNALANVTPTTLLNSGSDTSNSSKDLTGG